MSIAILGGLDRLKRNYEKTGENLGFEVKFFSQRVPSMSKRLSGVHGIVLFTDTISHPMVKEAMNVAKRFNIPVGRTRTSSVSSLKKCLDLFIPA
ncbi:DUF2325 domain-containing protein [Candidatus Saccharibacteria bacterium]|nr:DUF2325 domain-containing protein [Candidatus Saccharibacteria bacterium]NIV71772.1 DUF2325 domain-containing protein [Calditrichia bacterium]NIV98470.1 DUF2325 domain-containing protein [Candidatus Saccharibacteria bacterium]NIW78729.1 DUF2325 domain-containing protein [Calditrichia bacterium]